LGIKLVIFFLHKNNNNNTIGTNENQKILFLLIVSVMFYIAGKTAESIQSNVDLF